MSVTVRMIGMWKDKNNLISVLVMPLAKNLGCFSDLPNLGGQLIKSDLE
jgi:hypothetical protein